MNRFRVLYAIMWAGYLNKVRTYRFLVTLALTIVAGYLFVPPSTADYVTLASQDLVEPLDELDRPAFLALAAWSGEIRRIDNVHLDRAEDGFVADRGTRLETNSVLYRGED